MVKTFLLLAALLGFAAVGAGAMGAHGLEKRFQQQYEAEPERAEKLLKNWETASRYHTYHALALIGAAWVLSRIAPGARGRTAAQAAGWCFVAGIAGFSGSLYAWCLTETRWLVFVTPIGGTVLMIGWLCLALAVWRMPAAKSEA
ncbi:MAG: DUF423 domain-containing protein [Planctomycetes bacterium]|nr:DUF423 domain-containing protein [Planctomycetota bacterium]